MEIIIIPAIFFILAIALAVSCANIVPQENAYVIERFGRYLLPVIVLYIR